jgi:hypothetical protein
MGSFGCMSFLVASTEIGTNEAPWATRVVALIYMFGRVCIHVLVKVGPWDVASLTYILIEAT